jgi:hypothetical protein
MQSAKMLVFAAAATMEWRIPRAASFEGPQVEI